MIKLPETFEITGEEVVQVLNELSDELKENMRLLDQFQEKLVEDPKIMVFLVLKSIMTQTNPSVLISLFALGIVTGHKIALDQVIKEELKKVKP